MTWWYIYRLQINQFGATSSKVRVAPTCTVSGDGGRCVIDDFFTQIKGSTNTYTYSSDKNWDVAWSDGVSWLMNKGYGSKFDDSKLVPDVYGPGAPRYGEAPTFNIVVRQMTQYFQSAIAAKSIDPKDSSTLFNIQNMQGSLKGVVAARNVDMNAYVIKGITNYLAGKGFTNVVQTTDETVTTPVGTEWNYKKVDWQSTENAVVAATNQQRATDGLDPLPESQIRAKLISDFTEYRANFVNTDRFGKQHQRYIQNFQSLCGIPRIFARKASRVRCQWS